MAIRCGGAAGSSRRGTSSRRDGGRRDRSTTRAPARLLRRDRRRRSAAPAWRVVRRGPVGVCGASRRGTCSPAARTPDGDVAASMARPRKPARTRAWPATPSRCRRDVGGGRRANFTAHERDRDDLMGAYSRSYEYQDEQGTNYMVSCDFPYEGGWHELTVCYRGVGWELDEPDRRRPMASPRRRRVGADGSGAFRSPTASRAFLTVCAFDETGNADRLADDVAGGRLRGTR